MTYFVFLTCMILGMPIGYALSIPTMMLIDWLRFRRVMRECRQQPIPLIFGTNRSPGASHEG